MQLIMVLKGSSISQKQLFAVFMLLELLIDDVKQLEFMINLPRVKHDVNE